MSRAKKDRGARRHYKQPIEPTSGNPAWADERFRDFVLNACTAAGIMIGATPLAGADITTMTGLFTIAWAIGAKAGGGGSVPVRIALGVLAMTVLRVLPTQLG
ncbi:MAG: hypothetical protein OXG72_08395 [Acidobacteria bacterium]|nr:hypothetical protein [Acidobacteriota bacterium]